MLHFVTHPAVSPYKTNGGGDIGKLLQLTALSYTPSLLNNCNSVF